MDTRNDVTGAAGEAAPGVVPGSLATASSTETAADRRPVLVIGYGNTLRRDDGVGVRAAELMAADPRFAGVEVLTAYQLTPELTLDIARASLVVFVDADMRGLPGAIEVHELSSGDGAVGGLERPGPGASSHHVGATELLALARQLEGGSARAVAVGIGVADLELGEGLSAPVEAAAARAAEAVLELVADHRSR